MTSAACVTPGTAATARAAAGEMVKLCAVYEEVTVASAPAVCQDAATSPFDHRVAHHAGEGRHGEREDKGERGQRRGKGGGPGRPGEAEERGRARAARGGSQQSAQHQRVQPEHHDHRWDGHQYRRGAGVEVHARAGLHALVAEDDDARHRRGHQRRLHDQPGPGPLATGDGGRGGGADDAARPR